MAKRKTSSDKSKSKAKTDGKSKSKAGGGKRAKKFEQAAVVLPSHEEIAARAYEIWLKKGRPQGQDVQNWNEATRELADAKK